MLGFFFILEIVANNAGSHHKWVHLVVATVLVKSHLWLFWRRYELLPLDVALGLNLMLKLCHTRNCRNIRISWSRVCPPSILIVAGRCIRDPCTLMMVHVEQTRLAQNSIAPLIDTFIWMIDACLRSSGPFHNTFRTS